MIVANNNCGFGPQRRIYVYGAPTNQWVLTRKIWNEYTYHITNVNPDGTMEFDADTPPGIDVKGLAANKLTLDLVSSGSVTVTGESNSVPVPATIWLFLFGLIALVKRQI